jgi:hypothetical protein
MVKTALPELPIGDYAGEIAAGRPRKGGGGHFALGVFAVTRIETRGVDFDFDFAGPERRIR